jgi:hypothetical protein
VKGVSGNRDLYVGSGVDTVHRITHHPAIDYQAARSRLATASRDFRSVSGRALGRVLELVPRQRRGVPDGADGFDVRNVTNHVAGDFPFGWSPDGRKVLFRSTRDRSMNEIYAMPLDGSGARRITTTGQP